MFVDGVYVHTTNPSFTQPTWWATSPNIQIVAAQRCPVVNGAKDCEDNLDFQDLSVSDQQRTQENIAIFLNNRPPGSWPMTGEKMNLSSARGYF